MKANGRFFSFTAIFNIILGAIGFLILWPIRALTDNSIVAIIIVGLIFAAIAFYVNFFIVKRSKLKTPYFLFGTIVNIIVCAGLTALQMLV